MKEKIKKIRSKLFEEKMLSIVIILFIAIFALLVYFFCWRSLIFWEAISAVALILTIIVIAVQAVATKKYTKYLIMPNVFYFLKSINQTTPNGIKKSKLVIVNNSKFVILFHIYIEFRNDGEEPIFQKDYWKPKYIYAYPGKGEYEDIMNPMYGFKKIREKGLEKINIITNIKYAYAPAFAPEDESKECEESEWIFCYNPDAKKLDWKGPNGVWGSNINPY